MSRCEQRKKNVVKSYTHYSQKKLAEDITSFRILLMVSKPMGSLSFSSSTLALSYITIKWFHSEEYAFARAHCAMIMAVWLPFLQISLFVLTFNLQLTQIQN